LLSQLQRFIAYLLSLCNSGKNGHFAKATEG